MRRIVLTGGAGFIGTHLVRRLVNDGSRVVVFDSLERDALTATGLLDDPCVELVHGDVLDYEALVDVCAGADAIVHLAAIAGIDSVLVSPTRTMLVNMVGTQNLLAAAAEAGPQLERVIEFSTSEVFGQYAFKVDESQVTPMAAIGDARWTYAVSKLAGEHLAHAYHAEFGLPTVSVRPFNVFGPGQVGEGAIHRFVEAALGGDELLVSNGGDQIRAWCYIDDCIDAVVAILDTPASVGHVFNVGNARTAVAVADLAQRIIAMTGSKSRIRYVPRADADVELRVPDVKKAAEILDWRPLIDLQEGLELTIGWYRSQLAHRQEDDDADQEADAAEGYAATAPRPDQGTAPDPGERAERQPPQLAAASVRAATRR